MTKNGLTLSMIFQAESANYGEGFGNLTTLKKMTRGDGNEYSYISRQAIRYNIINQLGWDKTPVNDEKGVVQFSPAATITDYPEIDLFGYMKTISKKDDEKGKGGADTRSAVVRLSNAISLEAFKSDLDFLNNMGLAKRGGYENAIAQSEIHSSYYAYTIAVDLDRVGIDGDVKISNTEKSERINGLLDAILFLYRDIKGRRENLSPLFAIGGLYGRKNPYFEHRLSIDNNKINIETIKEILNSCDDVKNNSKVGVLSGIFANNEQIVSQLAAKTVAQVFAEIKLEVSDYYG